MSQALDTQFARISAWASANFPALIEGLNPGLSEHALSAAETNAGIALPDELRQLYLLADGEKPNGVGFFFGLKFLSFEELVKTAELWREVVQSDTELAEDGEFHSSDPVGAITAQYINLGWIAFAHDFGGNHLSVDTAPGPAGTIGQVINSGQDEENKRVISPSLASFLSWMADTLEAGKGTVTATGDASLPYEFLLAEPENRHFLDAVRKMQLPV